MADFEKVHTGHERWTARWPAVRAHACTLADFFGTGKWRPSLGAWPVALDAGPWSWQSLGAIRAVATV